MHIQPQSKKLKLPQEQDFNDEVQKQLHMHINHAKSNSPIQMITTIMKVNCQTS